MTDAPVGAPAPQPDTERHPRTKTTRLPYVVVVLIALAVVAIFGVMTLRERQTYSQEVVGLQVTPPATQPQMGATTAR
mgnify:CR=1 FL=1